MTDEENTSEEKEEVEDGEVAAEAAASKDRLDIAKEISKKLEQQLKKQEELVMKQEKLAVDRELGGRSEAGEKREIKEETAKEYADRIMGGEVKALIVGTPNNRKV